MFNGYTESEEKIEARKRRILGTVAQPEAQPAQSNDKLRKKMTADEQFKRRLLMMAILYPASFILGDLLGRLVASLVR